MMEVKFYDTVDDALLKFAVIISKAGDKWVSVSYTHLDVYKRQGQTTRRCLDTMQRR